MSIGLVATPKSEQAAEEEEAAEIMFSRSQDYVSTMNTATPRQNAIMQSANNSASRFSFFRRASSTHLRSNPEDLESLSIRETLFPDGILDETSPSAFKILQQNAENALKRFQQAYRENTLALRKVTSERNVQADELEAAQIRGEHLKAQLLDMAEKSAQQEKLIASLHAENEQMRANEAALRSIRVITDLTSVDTRSEPLATDLQSQRPAIRRNRSSSISYAESIDSASTDPESVFSHGPEHTDELRSPGTSVGCPSPIPKPARLVDSTIKKGSCRITTPSIQHDPQSSHLRSLTTNIMVAVPECQNCHGSRSNEAWEVLDVMKAESAALKERIHVLEQANDSVMDLLAWMPSPSSDVSSRCAQVLSAGGRAGIEAMDEAITRELARENDEMRGCIV